jgi:hypothetical protein
LTTLPKVTILPLDKRLTWATSGSATIKEKGRFGGPFTFPVPTAVFFPQEAWWDKAKQPVPDGVKYLCERWWELLKDWHCITAYSPPCGYYLSLLEDVSGVIDDLQDGRLRNSHQLDALKDELLDLLLNDRLLREHFKPEVATVVERFNALYQNLPPDPTNKFSAIKSRHVECRRAAMAARRLHHRCTRRRASQADMVWTGIGGLIGSDLMQEVVAAAPQFRQIDRLTVRLLLDSLYRGHNLDYLTSLFDRYLPEKDDLRQGLLHTFRRLHSQIKHRYEVLFILKGASRIRANPGQPVITVVTEAQIRDAHKGAQELEPFLAQTAPGPAGILRIEWADEPDAGAAAESCRQAIQEVVDYLDFESPNQRFELAPVALVTFADYQGTVYRRLHPDAAGEQPRWAEHEVEIEPEWVNQLKGLSEAFRWSSVARRERTPEVSLLAAWFAFEFLAGDLDKTPVEGIMEFFPKALAIGNIRRRLHYWWRSFVASPGFAKHARNADLLERIAPQGTFRLSSVFALLAESVAAVPTEDWTAVIEIATSSILLRERTAAEARLFTNHQQFAQTLKEDSQQLRWDLQRFLLIRNKLVHRARIVHPLLELVSERAKRLLYDLLRDISAQLATGRLRNSVSEVLHDFRDTFDDLLTDLGMAMPLDLVNRILLS